MAKQIIMSGSIEPYGKTWENLRKYFYDNYNDTLMNIKITHFNEYGKGHAIPVFNQNTRSPGPLLFDNLEFYFGKYITRVVKENTELVLYKNNGRLVIEISDDISERVIYIVFTLIDERDYKKPIRIEAKRIERDFLFSSNFLEMYNHDYQQIVMDFMEHYIDSEQDYLDDILEEEFPDGIPDDLSTWDYPDEVETAAWEWADDTQNYFWKDDMENVISALDKAHVYFRYNSKDDWERKEDEDPEYYGRIAKHVVDDLGDLVDDIISDARNRTRNGFHVAGYLARNKFYLILGDGDGYYGNFMDIEFTALDANMNPVRIKREDIWG